MNFACFGDEMHLDDKTARTFAKPCVFCGTDVTITKDEEKMFSSHGVNMATLRLSCPLCSDRKIQPMQSEDS
jgi:hypothetical protein